MVKRDGSPIRRMFGAHGERGREKNSRNRHPMPGSDHHGRNDEKKPDDYQRRSLRNPCPSERLAEEDFQAEQDEQGGQDRIALPFLPALMTQ